MKVFAALLIGALSIPARAQEAGPQDWSSYVEQARVDWQIPGLAFAILKDDSVVFSQGFGVSDVRSGEAVDENTLFSLASNTKAFVALAMMQLVDQGKVDLDAPVITYLPNFQVADPYVTRELTIRDLLSHRTGVRPTNPWDLIDSAEEGIRTLRFARQSSSLRSTWEYNNDMYVVAGAVIEAVSGQSWERFVTDHILSPLGMHATKTNGRGLADSQGVAQAHGLIDDTLRVVAYPQYTAGGAAGGMRSSLLEMTHWVKSLLDSTRVSHDRLVEPASFAELFHPQMFLEAPYYPATREAKPKFTAYGLGWFLQDYRGRFVAMHTGSLVGSGSLIGLLPEERLGVIILANSQQPELRHALMYQVFDHYLGGANNDWSSDLLVLYRNLQEQTESAWGARKRVPETRPTLDLASYAGDFADTIYGSLSIRIESGGLVMQFGPYTADLEHWHYDMFRAIDRGPWGKENKNPAWPGGEVWFPQFRIDARGDVSAVTFTSAFDGRAFYRTAAD